ncbi:MAG: ATP-binding protein [Planctomycetes bacterium]|nr:ATP-binding protein [Planctomycetota bacterium]
MFKRPLHATVLERLQGPRRFMQVLAGPRQSGKTTLIRQVLEDVSTAWHYASADEPALKDRVWIEQQWEAARRHLHGPRPHPAAILVLDEIHKIPGWSETVKRLWDEDCARRLRLHVVLLGSSPLLMQTGLAESLAGRFEIIPVTHWSFGEMRAAFGWTPEQFIFYGGYPGSAPLIEEPERWARYIRDALVETTVSRDILLMQRVDKPALLRRLFELGCLCSGQVFSFTKMLDQLHEAGNTTTLAHYLDLLRGAGLLEGLRKYAGRQVRRRASSPKFQVHNNALVTAQGDLSFQDALAQPDHWGHLVESAVGAWLVNSARGTHIQVFYWSSRNMEVDFVLARGRHVVAIEVKSGRRRAALRGMDAFAEAFPVQRKLLVGADGIPIAEFLESPIQAWF